MRACWVELTVTVGRAGGRAGTGAGRVGAGAVTALTGTGAGLGEGKRPCGKAKPPTSLAWCWVAATGCKPALDRSVEIATAPPVATMARPLMEATIGRQAEISRMADGQV